MLKKSKLFMAALGFGLATSYIAVANAASVPADVKLADVQELVKGNGAEPATLDPHKIEGVPASNIARDLFEALTNTDAEGKLVPGVAESWETSDNKVWKFNIRKDAKWSNGEPVTANDFVYSWRRVVDPETASPYAWYVELTAIENATDIIAGKKAPETLGVKALDDNTLEVTLTQALPYFALMTAHTTLQPAHKPTIDAHGEKWTSPGNMVSNGAYKLSDWVVNEKIVLVRNDQYWDNSNTVINKVSYLPIEDQVSEMNRFIAGELDMSYEIPNEHVKRLKKEYPNEFINPARLCSYYYNLNMTKKPFDDLNVRKALSYAIDRDVITNIILGAGQQAAYTFSHYGVGGINNFMPEYGALSQKERDSQATELLAKAGFGKDNPLKLTILYNTSENHKKIATAIASMWKKNLGVVAELENQEWKTYLDTKKAGNYDVARAGWCADYNEASSFLSLLQSNNTNNDSKYYNDGYDKIMADTQSSTSDEERTALYTKAEEKLVEDMPIAPIYHYTQPRLLQTNVGGYPYNNPENNLYTKDMYKIAK